MQSKNTKNLKFDLRQTSKDLATGTIVGMTQVLIFQPLNVVKIRLQTENSYTGILNCFKKIVRNEGFQALYRGSITPMLGVGLIYSLLFGINESLKRVTQSYLTNHNIQQQDFNKLPFAFLYLNGMVSGLIVSFVSHPFDLIRTKLNAQNSLKHYKGGVDVLRQSFRQFGIRGIYQGGVLGFTMNAIGNGCYFATYEYVKQKLESMSVNHKQGLINLIGGPLAGIISTAAIFPMDVLKCKMQADNLKSPIYHNIRQCYHATTSQGYKCLFRGFTVSLYRAPLTSFFAFFAYERVKKLMNRL